MSNEFQVKKKGKNVWNPMILEIDQGIAWGFFDGASQGHPPIFGVGVVLHLSQTHYIHIWYTLGRGSNNIVELISLRTLLIISQEKRVKKL
jgi:ribonuclease HI